MTTFVVLAAGRGSRLGRVGDELHKALIPLDGKAIISRQFELAPPDAKLVVVTGYRADQVESYVRLAHPDLDVTFVKEANWGRGPGASLRYARPEVDDDDDMIFVACDTLWTRNDALWSTEDSWVAVAPIPAGTPAARWCRVVPAANGVDVERVDDKTPTVAPGSLCWTALGRVAAEDLNVFWDGLDVADAVAGEIQLSSGLTELLNYGCPLMMMHVDWLDVGDADAYRAAQARYGTYDPVKPGQATYVLPGRRRVVKFHADQRKVNQRVERARLLGERVAPPVELQSGNMQAFEYVDGPSAYEVAERTGSTLVTERLLSWWHDWFLSTRAPEADRPASWQRLTHDFYRRKTFERVEQLSHELQPRALDAVTRVDWDALVDGVEPGLFHGDLTHANVIVPSVWRFVGIDWREDYAGQTSWGDLRYDVGKLLGGTRFHWDRARRGDFRFWSEGVEHERLINKFVDEVFNMDVHEVNVIGALTLINSAPLHAAPMDEILVARGVHWLDQLS